jgi:hypothetical protein
MGSPVVIAYVVDLHDGEVGSTWSFRSAWTATSSGTEGGVLFALQAEEEG